MPSRSSTAAKVENPYTLLRRGDSLVQVETARCGHPVNYRWSADALPDADDLATERDLLRADDCGVCKSARKRSGDALS